jgi:histidyl-tRNA synthetase
MTVSSPLVYNAGFLSKVMDVKSIRGTHDILPGSIELWQEIEATAHRLFQLYGFAEIRTPIIEQTDLFARSIGTDTDIVQKEMYSFSDTGGKSITLRPECTAPVVRSYIEHSLNTRGEPVKLYYIGPMFRRERPQKGRYRQFHQIGAEVLGTDHPAVEAEVIDMLVRFLGELGVEDYRLLVNSVGCAACRPAFVKLLRTHLQKLSDELCVPCQRRTETNPLRVLDCKVPSCQPAIQTLPKISESLCQECSQHYDEFLGYLNIQGVAYERDPRLVRGLDYYERTTFEIQSDKLGPTQNALLGGGRYDGLSEALGGVPAKGFGFAMGLERFVLLLSGREQLLGDYRPPAPKVFLVYFDEETFREALGLASELRSAGVFSYLDYQGRSFKAQMRLANRLEAEYTCVVGEDEVKTGIYSLKRMSDGHQEKMEKARLAESLLASED